MRTPAATSAPLRVMLITRNLPPVIGGMERLIGHVAAALGQHFDLVVVGPRGGQRAGRRYLACPLSPPWRFLSTAVGKASWAAIAAHPRVVLAGSGLVAPVARLAARVAGGRYGVYLHGLDIGTTHRWYRRLFVPAIRKADLVLANSRYTAGRAREAGVPGDRIVLLPPGVAIPESTPDHDRAAGEFRARYALPPGPILVGIGRLTPRKGFSEFVAESLPPILRAVPDAQFVLAGEVPRHAADRAGDEHTRIRRAAAAAGIADHVHLIGPLDDAGLARAWPAADVHVFPVRDDPADPEGFGMVALEAAAWGVPTVAFAAGGVPDAVADGVSGYLVTAGDYERFAGRVLEAVKARGALAPQARRFASRFAWSEFEPRLRAIIENLR